VPSHEELLRDLKLKGAPIGKGAFASVYLASYKGVVCAVRRRGCHGVSCIQNTHTYSPMHTHDDAAGFV
jgi:hypothetical protein